MNKVLSILAGLFFLALAIIGFVPGVVTGGYLFGSFFMDPAHCLVYLISAIVAFLAAAGSEYVAKTYLRIFGLLYLLAAIIGFVYGNQLIFRTITSNPGDNWLHLVIGVVLLALGFAIREQGTPLAQTPAI